jgi:hypothetical protein
MSKEKQRLEALLTEQESKLEACEVAVKIAQVEIADTQLKVMKHVKSNALHRGTSVQIAGYKRAPYLSACRALVRKGLMFTWNTGKYGLTEGGYIALAEKTEQAARTG